MPADKNDESRNRNRKEKGETGMRKGGDHERSPLKICIAVGKEKSIIPYYSRPKRVF